MKNKQFNLDSKDLLYKRLPLGYVNGRRIGDCWQKGGFNKKNIEDGLDEDIGVYYEH